MLFNSLDFAIFFPIVFILYWVFARNKNARNLLLLASSYVFYGWWDWRFLSLIIFSSALDYVIGKAIFQSSIQKKRQALLFLSLFVNLGFLVYFKYFNFFIETFTDAFRLFGQELEVSTLQIILPVGISFYTFQTLSYTIDIYRKRLEPTRDPLAFFTFVAFFPQLVAGPIERASHLLPQFDKIYKFDYEKVRSGLLLVAFGLFKKMVIADRLSVLVNEVYNHPSEYSGYQLAIATIFFSFQIYCDFSGYSDIAIGLSRTMGFDLMKNFRSPYFAKSITEFWHRWHISLSSWFRDYVYISMGGNRKKKARVYFNLFFVFFVSGLWHGAALTFIIWGSLHGLYIIIEKAIYKPKDRVLRWLNLQKPSFFNKLFFALITYLLVCYAWIFFRANTLSDSILIAKGIFINNYNEVANGGMYHLGLIKEEFLAGCVFVFLLLLFEYFHNRRNAFGWLTRRPFVIRWMVYLSIAMVILIFGIYGDNTPKEFIYFQF